VGNGSVDQRTCITLPIRDGSGRRTERGPLAQRRRWGTGGNRRKIKKSAKGEKKERSKRHMTPDRSCRAAEVLGEKSNIKIGMKDATLTRLRQMGHELGGKGGGGMSGGKEKSSLKTTGADWKTGLDFFLGCFCGLVW